MLGTKKFFIPVLVALNVILFTSNITTCMESIQTFDISSYKCKSASVLPVYKHKDKLCVIVTREAEGKDQKKGGKKYTYDDCSGGCEKKDANPLISAAREFWEEAILQESLGWNQEDTETFIKENTLYAIVYTKDKSIHNAKSRDVRNVTYVVDFSAHANTLFANFYSALKSEKERYRKLGTRKKHQHTTEKDRIGTIVWDDLKNASINNQRTIQAAVKNPQTNHFETKEVTLRPFLTAKLRPFFLDLPCEQGATDNIRHYHARLKEVYTFTSGASDECTCSSLEEK